MKKLGTKVAIAKSDFTFADGVLCVSDKFSSKFLLQTISNMKFHSIGQDLQHIYPLISTEQSTMAHTFAIVETYSFTKAYLKGV